MIKLIISALWLVGQAAKTPASHAGYAGSIPARVTIVGVDCDEVPPVPIPNTEVKLIGAEDTWLEAARENRLMPTPAVAILRTYSSLAQSVEHAAVNRRVVRSSRTGGAKAPPCILSAAFFQRVFSSVGQSPRLITGLSRVRIPDGPPPINRCIKPFSWLFQRFIFYTKNAIFTKLPQKCKSKHLNGRRVFLRSKLVGIAAVQIGHVYLRQTLPRQPPFRHTAASRRQKAPCSGANGCAPPPAAR